jgi:hypothetical protein
MWAPGGPISAQPKWLGLIQPNVKKKKIEGGQVCWVAYQPNQTLLGPA